MKKIKVYIASPYTKGDVAVNVKRQIDCSDALMDLGYVPFVPLLSHFQHMQHPRDYQDWIDVDLLWVESCDAVLRLEGESEGADGECAYAETLGIKVFHSIEDLNLWYSNVKEYSYLNSDKFEVKEYELELEAIKAFDRSNEREGQFVNNTDRDIWVKGYVACMKIFKQ